MLWHTHITDYSIGQGSDYAGCVDVRTLVTDTCKDSGNRKKDI